MKKSFRQFFTPQSQPSSKGGFTLLEILLYSLILALFLGSSIAFVNAILNTSDSSLDRNEIIANQEFIGKKISWIMGSVESIILPNASSSSTSTVSLNLLNANLTPAVFSFENESITLSLAGSSSVPLTNSRIIITDFLAEHFDSDDSPPTLRISFALQSVLRPSIVSSTTLSYVLSQN